ncbi:Hypothetical protein PHPALM_15428 [Phytophthora palmivora]|uniref:Uncharacterized protein n=1 Tax=Phytophthora palmivora TaxID=4796 RepID=A0A2P4XS95_9STRA|nr:Hypothetical protein PHPALM_15428 [Phytophthora palmivora]
MSKIKAKSGRKRVDRDSVLAKIQAVPIEARQVTRAAAAAAGGSRYMVNELLRKFALEFIDESTLQFSPIHNVIHVDEKWFNAAKDKRSYLVFDGGHPSL